MTGRHVTSIRLVTGESDDAGWTLTDADGRALFRVGSDDECNWRVLADGVRPRHFMLLWNGEELSVIDVGAGDVRVGGCRLEGTAIIRSGRIEFGSAAMVVESTRGTGIVMNELPAMSSDSMAKTFGPTEPPTSGPAPMSDAITMVAKTRSKASELTAVSAPPADALAATRRPLAAIKRAADTIMTPVVAGDHHAWPTAGIVRESEPAESDAQRRATAVVDVDPAMAARARPTVVIAAEKAATEARRTPPPSPGARPRRRAEQMPVSMPRAAARATMTLPTRARQEQSVADGVPRLTGSARSGSPPPTPRPPGVPLGPELARGSAGQSRARRESPPLVPDAAATAPLRPPATTAAGSGNLPSSSATGPGAAPVTQASSTASPPRAFAEPPASTGDAPPRASMGDGPPDGPPPSMGDGPPASMGDAPPPASMGDAPVAPAAARPPAPLEQTRCELPAAAAGKPRAAKAVLAATRVVSDAAPLSPPEPPPPGPPPVATTPTWARHLPPWARRLPPRTMILVALVAAAGIAAVLVAVTSPKAADADTPELAATTAPTLAAASLSDAAAPAPAEAPAAATNEARPETAARAVRDDAASPPPAPADPPAAEPGAATPAAVLDLVDPDDEIATRHCKSKRRCEPHTRERVAADLVAEGRYRAAAERYRSLAADTGDPRFDTFAEIIAARAADHCSQGECP